MSQVLKSQETIITIIITDSAGAFVTGLDPADVTLHFRKAGGSVTEKTLDTDNFTEIDATEMPGLYEVTFTASELNTIGEFVAILKQDGATAFANQTVRLEVVASIDATTVEPILEAITTSTTETQSTLSTVLSDIDEVNNLLNTLKESQIYKASSIPQNTSYPVTLRVQYEESPKTGITEASVYFVKNDGTVVSHDPVLAGSWTEIDDENLAGFYSFDIPKVETGELGDLFVVTSPTVAVIPAFEGWETKEVTTYLLRDINFANETKGWAGGGSSGFPPNPGVILTTDDGGATWVEEAELPHQINAIDSIEFMGNIVPYAVSEADDSMVYSHLYGQEGNWVNIPLNPTITDSINDLSFVLFDPYLALLVGDNDTIALDIGGTVTVLDTPNFGLGTTVWNTCTIIEGNEPTLWVGGTFGRLVKYEYDSDLDEWDLTNMTDVLDNDGENLESLDFTEDGLVGWVVGIDGYVAYTEDGGDTWSTSNLGGNFPLTFRSVEVLSSTEIWVFGNSSSGPVLVRYTGDGGDTWESRNATDSDVFVSATHVLPSGSLMAVGYNSGNIHDYVDREEEAITDTQTFRYQVVGESVTYNTTSHIKQGEPYTFPVRIKLEGKVPSAEILASELSLKIIKGDGSMSEGMSNTTWSLIDIETGLYTLTIGAEITDQEGELLLVLDPAAEKATERLFDDGDSIGPLFLDETTGQIWNSDSETGAGNIWTSDDDGETWQLQDDSETGFFAYMDGAYIGEDLHIFGMTSYNEDVWIWDGSNWTTGTLDGNGNGLHAYGEGQVWFVSQIGSEGRLEVWDNGFQTEYSQAGTPFNSVHQSSPTKLWVGGGGGALWEGTLSEGSWSFVDRSSDIATTSIIRSLEFIDEDNGWFGTADPEMYKTTDGGQTWVETTTAPDIFEAQHIVIISPDDIITYSDNGDISRTTNGGETWADPNLPFTIQGSYFWGEGYIVGGDGVETNFILTQSVEGKALDSQDIQVQVIENTSKDVLDDLNTVKGVGFTSGEDDLKSLKAAITAGGVDLSPVLDILDDMQGTEFDPLTDSLEALRDAVDNAETDLQPVMDILDEIKGGTFDEDTDALDALRAAVESVAGDVDLTSIETTLTSIQDSVTRVLGLSQENIRITGQNYDANNNLVESTITTYETAVDVENEENPLATYTMTASYNSDNRLVDYRIVRTT